MSISRIVNSFSQLSWRSEQISPSSKMPTGMTFVLDMLHFKPEISQKRLRIFMAVLKLISDLSIKKVQSSAKPEALSSYFA